MPDFIWPCSGCGEQTRSFYDRKTSAGIIASAACCPKCFKNICKAEGARAVRNGVFIVDDTKALLIYVRRESAAVEAAQWLFSLL